MQLYSKIAAFDTDSEALIIDSLVAELNTKYGTNLATGISYDRGSVAEPPDAEYENALFSGLDTLRRIIKDALFVSNVRDVTVLNTTQLCVTLDGARNTSTDIREALAIMCGDDPVHPSRDCYQALAEHLQSTLKQQQHGSASTSASVERPLKRPRWLEADSANTVAPRDSAGGRGRGNSNRSRGQRGGRRPRGFRGRY
jgi:hypothetical protein